MATTSWRCDTTDDDWISWLTTKEPLLQSHTEDQIFTPDMPMSNYQVERHHGESATTLVGPNGIMEPLLEFSYIIFHRDPV